MEIFEKFYIVQISSF